MLTEFIFYILLSIVVGLKIFGTFRKRLPGEPPAEFGWIPFIGVGHQYQRNVIKFLQNLRKKHGDIVTVHMSGNYIHVIMDPHSFDTFFRQEKNLDFEVLAQLMSHRAFGSPILTDTKLDTNKYNRLFHGYMTGKPLAALSKSMAENMLDALRLEKLDCDVGLLDLCYNILFPAALRTWFGRDVSSRGREKAASSGSKMTGDDEWREAGQTPPDQQSFGKDDQVSFRRFDAKFPALVSGLPASLLRLDGERNSLRGLFGNERFAKRRGISDFIQQIRDCMQEANYSDQEKQGVYFAQMFASQVNTVPAAFWAIYDILSNPEAMKEILLEIEREQPDILDYDSLKGLRLMESSIYESIRLRNASLLIRYVKQDISITMDSGKNYSLRKGDYIALATTLTHLDPEVFEEPEKYKVDRFIGADGELNLKKGFTKNRRRVKYPILPFGGGVVVCPGRWLAMTEIKQFLVMLIREADIELIDRKPMKEMKFSLGILRPSHDPLVKIKRKRSKKF